MSVRRMRSGELHYFDHPLFGVLMQDLASSSPSTGTHRRLD